MTDVDGQIPLALPGKAQEVDIEAVRRQPSMTKALILCADLAGFENDKDLCRVIGMDPAIWSRIKTGQAHFPQDKYVDLMIQARNDVPLIWLADRRGFVLTPKESELERRLRTEKEGRLRAEEKVAMLTEILQGKAVAKA